MHTTKLLALLSILLTACGGENIESESRSSSLDYPYNYTYYYDEYYQSDPIFRWNDFDFKQLGFLSLEEDWFNRCVIRTGMKLQYRHKKSGQWRTAGETFTKSIYDLRTTWDNRSSYISGYSETSRGDLWLTTAYLPDSCGVYNIKVQGTFIAEFEGHIDTWAVDWKVN